MRTIVEASAGNTSEKMEATISATSSSSAMTSTLLAVSLMKSIPIPVNSIK